MPDDYYVLQRSGEEIDERLTAAHNAVRYDAAQTLTDAQKTQARANIGAAPGGFGWGDSAQYTFKTNEDFKAWFMQNAAPKCARNTFAASVFIADVINNRMLIIASGNSLTSDIVIVGYTYNGYELRATVDYNGILKPWEWVNPPMELGKEYRTTGRYLGKPVYTKLVDCGEMPSGTTKTVDVGVENLLRKVSVEAMMYYSATDNWTLPLHNGSFDVDVWFNNQGISIRAQQSGLSAYTGYVTIKYTKTTD